MEQIVNLITQNGIGVICVAYFIYFQCKQWPEMMNKFIDALDKMNGRLSRIETKLDISEGDET